MNVKPATAPLLLSLPVRGSADVVTVVGVVPIVVVVTVAWVLPVNVVVVASPTTVDVVCGTVVVVS
jgi:hypothetical protein